MRYVAHREGAEDGCSLYVSCHRIQVLSIKNNVVSRDDARGGGVRGEAVGGVREIQWGTAVGIYNGFCIR